MADARGAGKETGKILKSKVLYQGRLFGVRRDEVLEPDGSRTTPVIRPTFCCACSMSDAQKIHVDTVDKTRAFCLFAIYRFPLSVLVYRNRHFDGAGMFAGVL